MSIVLLLRRLLSEY